MSEKRTVMNYMPSATPMAEAVCAPAQEKDALTPDERRIFEEGKKQFGDIYKKLAE